MPFEIPHDLINRVKVTLRKEANISSYDPEDSSLPNLPSIQQSISELDPSPPHLRCKQCQARLLLGLQSVVCVFCGHNQRQELPPEPINFKSTFGYTCFLNYLDLKETEMVEPPLEADELILRKDTDKNEVPLSDLLDLEIKWPIRSEKLKPSLEAKSSFLGVDLDNILSEANTPSSSHEEKLVPNYQIKSSNFSVLQGQENVNLFENVQPSEIVVSTEDKSGEPFTGWEADFKSATTGNLHEESKPFDPFAGSTNDLSLHMDAVFGPIDEKPNTIPSTSNMNDFFQDDLLNSSNLVNVKDGGKVESVNWIQDEKWQTSSDKDPVSKTVYEDDDSFDVWNDFTSSTTAQNPPNSIWVQPVNHMTSPIEQGPEINLFGSTNISQEIDFGSFSQPDFFSGPLSKQNGLTGGGDTEFEASFSDRVVEADAEAKTKDGGNSEGVMGIEDVAIEDKSAQADASETLISQMHDLSFAIEDKSPQADAAETLISQMHDLSFMLDSNLSIPPKID